MKNKRMQRWLVWMAVTSAVASVVAIGFVWLVLTRPVDVAQALAKVL